MGGSQGPHLGKLSHPHPKVTGPFCVVSIRWGRARRLPSSRFRGGVPTSGHATLCKGLFFPLWARPGEGPVSERQGTAELSEALCRAGGLCPRCYRAGSWGQGMWGGRAGPLCVFSSGVHQGGAVQGHPLTPCAFPECAEWGGMWGCPMCISRPAVGCRRLSR